MSATKNLKTKVSEAQEAKRLVEFKISEEKKALAAKIDEKYADDLRAAWTRVSQAEKALREHIDATSNHPWEGKRVFQIKERRGQWSNKVIGEDRLSGIVEVVRQDTEMPANLRWSVPSLGSIIVRKLKKNGEPGVQFHDRAYAGEGVKYLEKEWTLEEGQEQ